MTEINKAYATKVDPIDQRAYATRADVGSPIHEAYATGDESAMTTAAHKVWSGPSNIAWSRPNQDQPADLHYGSPFARGDRPDRPDRPAFAQNVDEPAGMGRPPFAENVGRPSDIAQGYAVANEAKQPPDRPDFWRNLGESVKHMLTDA